MSTNQATPRPWKPSTCGLGVWSANEPLGDNKIIANCNAVARSAIENEANACHIVRCVNLHDELLAALRTVVEMENACCTCSTSASRHRRSNSTTRTSTATARR